MKERILTFLRNRRETLLKAGAAGAYGLLVAAVLWAGAARVRFAEVSRGGKPCAAASSTESGQEETEKLTYERLKNGDTLYCNYFGILNVHEEPSAGSAVIDQLTYGDQVQAFWKEDSGYVRILAKKANSDRTVEGFCLGSQLTEEAPEDGRLYLNVVKYRQDDERWGAVPLGESYETLATAGCTTTCLAMAYTYLEGTATTPDGMVERLYYTEDGYLGFPKVYEKYDQKDYLSTVLAKLKEGIPVLAGAKNDGGGQHWVLIVGYEGDGSELKAEDFVIHDPIAPWRYTLAEFFAKYPIFNTIAYYKG